MKTQNHSFTDRSTDAASIKKGAGFVVSMSGFYNRLFKLRSSRGYGSRKSAYSYYMRNI